MRFTELREEINNSLEEVNSLQDYISVYLTTPIKNRIDELEDKFVEHLFEDLIQKKLEINISTYVGGSYRAANEFAKDCVVTAFWAQDLYGYKIKSWTDSALKCFDNLLLVLIQERLNETIAKRLDVGQERQKYRHLMEKGGDYNEIGAGFDAIYQQRSSFYHIELIDDNGKRVQKPLSKKNIRKAKELILSLFKKSLLALEKIIKRDEF